MIDLPIPDRNELDQLLHEHDGNTCALQAAAMGQSASRLIASPHADMLLSLVGLAPPMAHVVDRSAEIIWWWVDFAMPGVNDPQMIARWVLGALAGSPDKPPFPVAAAVVWVGGRRFGLRWPASAPWRPTSPGFPETISPIVAS
jgi:hypothetical protein